MTEQTRAGTTRTAQLFKEVEALEGMMLMPEERLWLEKPREAGREANPVDTVLYLGCNVLRTPHLAQAAVSVLQRLGENFVALGGPAFCCGIPFKFEGKDAEARRFGERTASEFQRFRPRQVVMWCPGCVTFYEQALNYKGPFRIVHISEFLAENCHRLPFLAQTRTRVAFHYHSTAPDAEKQASAARAVLKAVPGVELVEIGMSSSFGRSCSGRVRDELGREAWEALCADFVQKAVDAGADVFATIYHGCHRMFACYQAQFPLTIEHYLTFVARAMGIEHRDKCKDYFMWRDHQKIMEDANPCLKANRIDPGFASALIDQVFIRRSGF